jgi:hypothetical protein
MFDYVVTTKIKPLLFLNLLTMCVEPQKPVVDRDKWKRRWQLWKLHKSKLYARTARVWALCANPGSAVRQVCPAGHVLEPAIGARGVHPNVPSVHQGSSVDALARATDKIVDDADVVNVQYYNTVCHPVSER